MDTAYSYSVNPSQLRPKYYEGIDLIMKAWQATEPFSFNGRFNQYRYVNPVPRPWQQPHPPVWIPGGGSVETWDFCAENDFVYGALTYYGYKMVRETVGGYWRQVEANGKDDNPHRLAVTQFIGVADTDAEARQLYREPAEYFFNRSLHVDPGFTDAPGYVTEASVRARYKSQVRQAARSKQAKHDLTWDEMLENGYVVIGSPDTVREQLEEAARELRIGHLCAMLQFGNMSDELTRYNSKLFGDKVAPGPADAVLRVPRSLVAGERPMSERQRAMARAAESGTTPEPATNSSTSGGSPGTPSCRPPCDRWPTTGGRSSSPPSPGFDGDSGLRRPRRPPGLDHDLLGRPRRHRRAALPGDRRLRSAAWWPPSWPRSARRRSPPSV